MVRIFNEHTVARLARLFSSIAIATATTAVAASPAFAKDCKDYCDQYQHLVQFSLLGSEASDISLMALHPEQDPLAWTNERREAMRTSILSNSLIPDGCKQTLITKNLLRFTVIASGSAGSPPPGFSSAAGATPTLLGAYQGLVDAQVQNACNGSSNYNNCVTTNGKTAFNNFRGQFESQSPQSLAAGAAGTPLAGLNASQIQTLQVYSHIIGLQTNDQLAGYLGGLKNKLTTDQKLQIGQMIGSMGDNPGYNSARNVIGSPAAAGVVTTGQILGANYNNTLAGGTGRTRSGRSCSRPASAATPIR